VNTNSFVACKDHPLSVRNGAVRSLHEAVFSLNLAFGFMAFFLYDMPAGLERRAIKLDLFLNRLLHIRETDLLTLGWSFFLLGIVLALIVWMLLRLLSRTEIEHAVLRSTGGILAISAAPSWYIWATYHADTTVGSSWPILRHPESYEFVVVLVCMCLYLKGTLRLPRPVGVIFLIGHSAFWLWAYRFSFLGMIQGGGRYEAVTPVLGLLAAFAWAVYLQGHLDLERQSDRNVAK
jgi:hypothetical protein